MKTICYAKRIACAILLIVLAVCSTTSRAQMKVPAGWENEDSVRIAAYFGYTGVGFPYKETDARMRRLLDSLGIKMIMSYGKVDATAQPIYGGQRGYIAKDDDRSIGGVNGLTDFGKNLRQRIFYPTPAVTPQDWDDGGYRWRYIDTVRYTWNNNTYDANDISPFAKFDSSATLAQQKYFSRMYHSSGDSLSIGTDGRVILGYNDSRKADNLLATHLKYAFQNKSAIPQAFSARLEFAIDTTQIYTVNNPTGVKDSVPLLRVQILFKKGIGKIPTDPGWEVLPFVPFKRTPTGTESGWYAIIDTVISPAVYHSLRESWRTPDTLENGSAAHEWKFKQMNLVLKNLPSYMMDYVQEDSSFQLDQFGKGSGLPRIVGIQNSDSLVNIEADDLVYRDKDDTTKHIKNFPLFEIRLLSTYRAPVYIRSVSWQDTMADNFLYRARFSDGTKDSTHSLNPATGAYGGLDDLIKTNIELWADTIFATNCKAREVLFNDIVPYMPFNAMSGVAYVDAMLSRSNIHTHMRPQEGGAKSLAMRRERRSYDGIAPKIVENETADTYSQRFKSFHWLVPDKILNVFPGDYVPTTSLGIGSWPSDTKDTMMGMLIGRPGTALETDTFFAYRCYTEISEIQQTIQSIRGTARSVLDHPQNTRSSFETSPMTWGFPDGMNKYNQAWAIKHGVNNWEFLKDTLFDPESGALIRIYPRYSASYSSRPNTPEEVYAIYYVALANGAGAFDVGQYFDGSGGPDGGTAASFNFAVRHNATDDGAYLQYNYNFGHRRSQWGADDWLASNHNVIDSTIPEYYLGFSNHFRANYRIQSRMNQIYGNANGNKYPFKRMSWMDSYSACRALSKVDTIFKLAADSISLSKAFLKCTRTLPVKHWSRGTKNEYIDSTTFDSLQRTYVEVGLFKDSISPSKVNYAAMVVNTRLWPDRKLEGDALYYTQGLANRDKFHSLFGDIDVRKVFFKIDSNALPASFRSGYYVVRDTWHPDTTWLVKADSEFAVYIKPGDARLLYIEKGIAITAAPNAASSALEFAFNNGRRVAERTTATRDIVTYTRNDSLFVSTPLRGKLVAGSNQRSDGDNISTGIETCIDAGTAGACHRPSVCVGRNGKSVAIVYWKSPSRLCVAYQHGIDYPWKLATDPTNGFLDTTADFSGVTPVCTPISDSQWIAVAAYQKNGANKSGIVLQRFHTQSVIVAGHFDTLIKFDSTSNNPIYLTQDADSTKPSKFPTVASRPLPDSVFPVRVAWQNNGQIMYNRLKWPHNVATPTADVAVMISAGLPSDCTNTHPSIATVGFDNGPRIVSSLKLPPEIPQPSQITLNDYVTWEAVLKDTPAVVSHGQFWPVMRSNSQASNRSKQTWTNSFMIFKPDTISDGFRLPNITAGNAGFPFVPAVQLNPGSILLGKPRKATAATGFRNFVQIAWENQTSERLELAMNTGTWFKGGLLERGLTPSQGLTTDSITNKEFIPRSLVFIGQQPNRDSTKSLVRITNGWTPWIDTVEVMGTTLRFTIKPKITFPCNSIIRVMGTVGNGGVGPFGGPLFGISWTATDQTDPLVLGADWLPGPPSSPSELASTNFPLNNNDQITINRAMDVDDTAQIRAALNSATDTVSITYTLRKSSDSSRIAVLEQTIITKDTIIGPGYGLNASQLNYLYSGSSDTAFISIDIARKETDSLDRYAIVLNDGDDLPLSAYKKAAPPKVAATPKQLSVAVIPNPFHSSTQITIEPVENLPLTVTLFDELGRKVAELFNGIGDHERYEFTLTNAQLSVGLYYLRIQNGTTVATKKVELLK